MLFKIESLFNFSREAIDKVISGWTSNHSVDQNVDSDLGRHKFAICLEFLDLLASW